MVLPAGFDDDEVLESGGGRQRIIRRGKTDGATDPDIVYARRLIEARGRSGELRARRRVAGATLDWIHDARGESPSVTVARDRNSLEATSLKAQQLEYSQTS